MSASGDAFPETRQSLLVRVRADDRSVRARAYELLMRAYWRPIYKHLRLRWQRPRPEAEELTQGFFVDALEADLFARYDARRAKLRTFLRVCVDRMAMDDQRARSRKKRGGGARPLSWEADVAVIENELAVEAPPADFDRAFEDEWRRSILSAAVESLRAECIARGRERHLAVFELHDLAHGDDAPSYDEVASRLGITVAEVTYSLSRARKSLRRHVVERLRDAVVDEAELADEARAFGIEGVARARETS